MSMSNNIEIRIDGWLPDGEGPDPVARTNAEVFVGIGDSCATEVQDRQANTVRQTIRVSAYLFATWLASNWWRLTLEPERERFADDSARLDWKLSHQSGAIGGGYLWPPLTFASDRFRVSVRSDASASFMRPELSPVRYLNTFESIVNVEALEGAIEAFVGAVISRLDALSLRATPLHQLWKEVATERRDPKLCAKRSIEAMLGLDPDTDANLIGAIQTWEKKAGREAVYEIAAAMSVHKDREIFSQTDAAIRGVTTFARIEQYSAIQPAIANLGTLTTHIPWELGKRVAECLRRIWNLGSEPILNAALGAMLNVEETTLKSDGAPTPLSVGVRGGNEDQLKLVLRPLENPPGRRFEIARLLGDFLLSDIQTGWLPVTTALTARQKFQRAFAAEFLCPSEALKMRFQTEVGDSDEIEMKISKIASEFGVSQRMVRHHLDNRGVFRGIASGLPVLAA